MSLKVLAFALRSDSLLGLGLGPEHLSFGLVLVICGIYNKADKNKTKKNFVLIFIRVKISFYIFRIEYL